MISLGCLVEPFQFLRREHKSTSIELEVYRVGYTKEASQFSLPTATGSLHDLIDTLPQLLKPDVVFLCSGTNVAPELRPDLRALVRACIRNRVRLASIGSVTWLMAEEGAISGKNCAVHWSSAVAFSERHNSFNVSTNLFEANGKIDTCAGELATLDFMIDFVAHEFGEDVARQLCDFVLVSGARSGNSDQPRAQTNRLLHYPLIIQEVVREMSNSLEEPVSINELAASTAISQRQLERLFLRYLKKISKKILPKSAA